MHPKNIIALFTITLLSWGCATQNPYDYSALQASAPRSILVLPPLNDTVEVMAPYIYLSSISRPLAEKGYYVFPVSVIDQFMKDNGLPTPAEMNAVPLDKLTEILNPDAILYTRITDWGQQYQVLSSKAVVKAGLRLVDARSGKLLWDANAYAIQESSDGGGGLVGALVGAVVDQIAGSISDKTPALSRQASYGAIHNPHRGLLNGPYRPVISENK